MPRYIALLRAINVGGHVVRMERLRALFSDLGLSNVETVIASGNVMFDSRSRSTAALETRIEAHLRDQLGYDVATFLRSPAEMAAAAALRPFDGEAVDTPGASVYVTFLKAPLTPDAATTVRAFSDAVYRFEPHGREVYWLRRTRAADPPVSPARLERAFGGPGTTRNLTTVTRIAALTGEGGRGK